MWWKEKGKTESFRSQRGSVHNNILRLSFVRFQQRNSIEVENRENIFLLLAAKDI